MIFKFASMFALATTSLSGYVSAVPTVDVQQSVTCAVCPKTIVYAGVTRTLALAKEEEENTIQCDYDIPAIPGFNPACLYANVNGALLFTNTGGSCTTPSLVVQTGPSCTTKPF